MIISELKNGYAIVKSDDDGWLVLDIFGIVNQAPLPSMRAAELFLDGYLNPGRLS
jgi:hypothetical protein